MTQDVTLTRRVLQFEIPVARGQPAIDDGRDLDQMLA